MDIRAKKALEEIKQLSLQVFNKNLIGVYVHGSLSFGCFNWDNSDIDFIVVLDNIATQEQKEKYISGLLNINNRGPSKGLEMSIVLKKYAHQFVYPTPYELHFSSSHLKQCTNEIKTYCQQMNGTDKDLAAHFTIINNNCITLFGAPAKDIFGEVPKSDYLDSIKCDIIDAEKEVIENPIYTILNLCRVLAYKCDGLILSKKDGGTWGIKHLDQQYSVIIKKALEAYQGCHTFHCEDNGEALIAFARYSLHLIYD